MASRAPQPAAPRVSRPAARYRRGQGVQQADSSSDEDDDGAGAGVARAGDEDDDGEPHLAPAAAQRRPQGTMALNVKDARVGGGAHKDGDEDDEYETGSFRLSALASRIGI